MTNIVFKRVLHPVGHGAFFTEEICFDGIIYNIVYDCGSKSKSLVKYRIKEFVGTNRHIDLIFISHFDSDHINCLKELSDNIDSNTKIIIPFYYPAFHQLVGQENTSYIDTIGEMFAFFTEKNIQLLMVRSNEYFESEFPVDIRYISGDRIVLLNGLPATIISNGIRICIFDKNNTPIWNYVPFNYGEDNEHKIQEKLKELNLIDKDEQLIEEEFMSLLQQAKDSNRSNPKDTRLLELKSIYNSIAYGSINTNSLQLLSYEDQHITGVEYDYKLGPLTHIGETQNWIHKYRCSCLYTGDTNLKNPDALETIKIIKRKYLHDNLMLIQIPHHGSKNNYNPEIVGIAEAGFVNFKPKVQYCHFDCNIPTDYMADNRYLICVTDTSIYLLSRIKE